MDFRIRVHEDIGDRRGTIGGTLGEKWRLAGHQVVYGLRDPSKKKSAATIAESLKGAEAVLLALPAGALDQFVQDHARQLDGKILIDATNNFGGETFHQWPTLVGAVPKAHLFRAFNSLGWEVFANPVIGGAQADLFYAGPEGPSQKDVERLIEDIGLRPVWVGDADHAETVDGVLRLWYTLSRRFGRHIAFKLLTD